MKSSLHLSFQSKAKELLENIKTGEIKKTLLYPQTLLLVLVFFLLPFFLICYQFYEQYALLSKKEQEIQHLRWKARKTALVRSRAALFSKKAIESDPNFLDKNLVSFPMLIKEKKYLSALQDIQDLKESALITKRIEEIASNQIIFEKVRSEEKEGITETFFSLKEPVQLDEEDVFSLLDIVEDPLYINAKQRPQLFFQGFHLKKTKISSYNTVYFCKFDLVERKAASKENSYAKTF